MIDLQLLRSSLDTVGARLAARGYRFDRDAFHEVMNREIVEFFNRTLRPAGNTPIRGAQPSSCRSRESR